MTVLGYDMNNEVTKQLPTAEIELRGSEATLVSESGRGIAGISSLLQHVSVSNCSDNGLDINLPQKHKMHMI